MNTTFSCIFLYPEITSFSLSHLRCPNALTHLVPVVSLWDSTLRPLLFRARTLSPTSACAKPVSTSAIPLSSSSSSPSAPSSPDAALRFPHTMRALCSASGSPAAWKSRLSCRRFTPWKMLAVPDLRVRRSEAGGRENVGWDGPARTGAEATSSICGARGEGQKGQVVWSTSEKPTSNFLHEIILYMAAKMFLSKHFTCVVKVSFIYLFI